MLENKKIKTALVSVFHKDGLDEILKLLHAEGVEFISTGGTQSFIESLGIPCGAVEDLTGYPSILGGRVKTLHPKVFGGILNRRENETDQQQIAQYEIPSIDLVIVDLYPFEETVASGADESAIIEKIDIGGISLIRAAAKNYKDVVIVASKAQYAPLLSLLKEKGANTSLEDRRWFAKEAFAVSSGYDSAIFNYFDGGEGSAFRYAGNHAKVLRYGENPHQKGVFYGNFDEMFEQLHGKEISYNNLLDIDAAVSLIAEFDDTTFAILKHNNACGLASRDTLLEAWKDALAGDPVSAFGGVLITNRTVDKATAEEMHKIFFEVCIAPGYDPEALEVLEQKKNRIILVQKPFQAPARQFRSLLNGVLVQDRDLYREKPENACPGRGPAVCQQDCETQQIKRHRAGQEPSALCQRYRADLACRCFASSHRESPLVQLRSEGSRDGIRCLLPLLGLRGDCPRSRGRCRDTTGRIDSRQRVDRVLQPAWHSHGDDRHTSLQTLI